jgi:transglutaminase-like putative cysteine protease
MSDPHQDRDPRAGLPGPVPERAERVTSDDPADFLAPGWFVDSDHPDVVAYARRVTGDAPAAREQAVAIYYAVRDGIRYDPYSSSSRRDDFRASTIVHQRAAFCVPKAILMAAACRASGISARLGYADVRNHLTSEKLRERMRSDLFVFHGFVEVWIDGAWRKATPTFNLELCERFGVKPLDFNGIDDALMHPFDTEGRRHMEYVRDRGRYFDFPMEAMLEAWREEYPASMTAGTKADDDEAFH